MPTRRPDSKPPTLAEQAEHVRLMARRDRRRDVSRRERASAAGRGRIAERPRSSSR